MIPTLEEIIEGLIAGTVTREQAWRWIHATFELPFPPLGSLIVTQREGGTRDAHVIAYETARTLPVGMYDLYGSPTPAGDNYERAAVKPQRVCAHCQTQIIPAGLTECPKCDKPVMP